MQRIGYVRLSSIDQDWSIQTDALTRSLAHLSLIIAVTRLSGNISFRAQLASAANTCRGSLLIARNNAFAGPVGSRLPCSQFLNVPKFTSIR